jgi:hypothetical protein
MVKIYSTKTSLKSISEIAITANMNANKSRISGIVSARGCPDIILAPACIPGKSMGIDTGKKRNDNKRFLPSEYITRAESMEPISARSNTPIT